MSFTANDISYWSMLPALSVDQKEREKIGAIARICANIGLFFVVASIVPLTALLGEKFGSLQKGYFIFALAVTAVMVAGQCITLFGVKESGVVVDKGQSTPLRELFRVIVKNDQLFITAVAMSLFMIGYMTTTSFGLYFFKYAYGDEGMYAIFALVLGVSQITALAVFPLFSKRFERKTLYTAAIVLIVSGYIIFFFAPTTTMLFIGAAGILLFVGQSFVELLMLMFLADSVDYGHWKLGKRNDSITFSLQPFINKMGGAIASGVVSAVVIVSGIKEAETATDVSASGLLLMKIAMLVFPLLCIVTSYIIYRKKYEIDSKFYGQIVSDLRGRGELKGE
jgi:melibiose permease/lactose/raffinose/galactose permease